MNQSVLLRILGVVFPASSSQVTLGVPIALVISIDRYCESKAPDIELSILVQEWLLHILLDNVRPLASIHIGVAYQTFNMIDVSTHLNSTPPVGVLSRLHNPHGRSKFGVLLQSIVIRRIVVHFSELAEFSIVFTLLNVESKGNVVEWVNTLRLVEYLHVVVNGFFVAQMEIILLMVCR